MQFFYLSFSLRIPIYFKSFKFESKFRRRKVETNEVGKQEIHIWTRRHRQICIAKFEDKIFLKKSTWKSFENKLKVLFTNRVLPIILLQRDANIGDFFLKAINNVFFRICFFCSHYFSTSSVKFFYVDTCILMLILATFRWFPIYAYKYNAWF
jgi:hypothetical protein